MLILTEKSVNIFDLLNEEEGMPRTREQFEEIKTARRQEIINSAIRIFCQKGYDNAKIDDIMRDCQCSHGLMYHYFRNKDEIFRDILISAARHSDEMYERHFSGRMPTKKAFEQMVRNYLAGIESDENFAYFIHFMSTLHLIRYDFDYAELFRAYPRRWRPKDIMADLFKKGQDAGFIRKDDSPGALATMFFGFFQGVAYQRVFALFQGTECELPKPETLLSAILAPTT